MSTSERHQKEVLELFLRVEHVTEVKEINHLWNGFAG
ncbi:MAG: hypothetical protein SCAL_000690 [Candidatus Syntrophoarchaeum caldarius]|uniref:Uncharacterized protein n=1 Tax=Candidatus Syntropharchaeum caldarium TaxID=1838285 RepID=A0A1F2P9J6_9EURY|nr:MAG: hypothetical protein SCAL_000690 [Candidatus Syntrophoarchaeum caldarius]